jgi:hypothetical protein
VVNRLLPKRQLRTNAHPLVEITMMRQANRTLLHLVNLSGHSDTAYFDALPMSGIRIQVAGGFRSARVVSTGKSLPLTRAGDDVEFVLPSLGQYELVELR